MCARVKVWAKTLWTLWIWMGE